MFLKNILPTLRQTLKLKSYTEISKFRQFSSNNTENIQLNNSLYCFTEDEIQLKEAAQKYCQNRILPLVGQFEKEGLPDEIIKELFENGFMSIDVPSDYGGSGCSFFSSLLVIEEFAKVDMGTSLYIDLQNTLMNNLMLNLGTPEQKEKYLTRLCSKSIGAFCLSEESSGSDAFALKAVAKKEGSNYILNGTKIWVSSADKAEVFFVFVNAQPEKKHKGITIFIVDKDTEGFIIGKKEHKMGLRSSGTCTVIMENVKVDEKQILGELGQGYKYAITMLNGGRIGIGAQLVGVSQGCLDNTIPYLLQRKQFGKKLFDFQGIQHQVARMYTQLEAARLMVYNAGRIKDKGLPYVKEASMAKYFSTELACEITKKCIQWLGGIGFSQEFPVEKYYRDCVVGTVYEGTSNMQLNTIAKFISNHYQSGI